MQKGFAHILLLIIVLIAGAGAAYYFGYDHGFEKSVKTFQTPTSFPTATTSSETQNWKTYKNTKHSFEFLYPDGWYIGTGMQELSTSDKVWLADEEPHIEEYGTFSVEAHNEDIECENLEEKETISIQKGLKAFAEHFQNSNNISDLRETTFAGEKAYEFDLKNKWARGKICGGEIFNNPRIVTFVEKNKTIFIIMYSLNNPIFKNTFSTFKFTY